MIARRNASFLAPTLDLDEYEVSADPNALGLFRLLEDHEQVTVRR